jgi:hypothetical protein
MPDGSFSEAELSRLEDEGAIEVHRPGTPRWHAASRAMREQLVAHDAEMLEKEGPDTLTSDRLLRQTAIAAERDPELVGRPSPRSAAPAAGSARTWPTGWGSRQPSSPPWRCSHVPKATWARATAQTPSGWRPCWTADRWKRL